MSQPQDNPEAGREDISRDLDTAQNGGGAVEPHATRCRYCGAPLDERVYFCLRCATPYKPIEHLLPVVHPQQPTDGVLIRKKAPNAMNVFWVYFGLMVALIFVFLILHIEDNEHAGALYYIVAEFGMIAVTTVIGFVFWRSLAAQFKRLGFFRVEAWIGVAALVPLLAINFGMQELFELLLGAEGESLKDYFRGLGFGRLGMVLMIAVVPAVTEEIAFRGLVQHWMNVAVGSRKAILYASLLFTALHFNPLAAPYLLAVGLVLGWVKNKTGSLYPSMTIHFMHNLAVLELFG